MKPLLRQFKRAFIAVHAESARAVAAAMDALRRAVPQVLQQAESLLMPLALEAARRIVAEMPITPELVERVVREALQQAEDTAEVTIRVHPDDLALLRQYGSELLQGLPGSGPLKFVASSEVSRGGCLIQTRFGLVDARRETKLEQLQQTLLP